MRKSLSINDLCEPGPRKSLSINRLRHKCKKDRFFLAVSCLLCDSIGMETIRKLLDRIDELQQIIDLETDTANEGCIRSRQLVINAEIEKEDIQDTIDLLTINNILA